MELPKFKSGRVHLRITGITLYGLTLVDCQEEEVAMLEGQLTAQQEQLDAKSGVYTEQQDRLKELTGKYKDIEAKMKAVTDDVDALKVLM